MKDSFKNKEIEFYFQMNTPFLTFPKVTKTIDVSLWGNIHEKHEIDAINEGAFPEDEYTGL